MSPPRPPRLYFSLFPLRLPTLLDVEKEKFVKLKLKLVLYKPLHTVYLGLLTTANHQPAQGRPVVSSVYGGEGSYFIFMSHRINKGQ